WELTVLDATRGETVVRVGQVADLSRITFSPDDTRLATGGMDGIVRVFDAADGRECAVLFTGCIDLSGLALSPDGRRLYAAGGGMGGGKVFEPARDPRGRRVLGVDHQIGALTYDREGLRVRAIGWGGGGLNSADPVDGTVRIDRWLPVTDA